MSYKNNTCPRCKSELTAKQINQEKQSERRGRWGLALGASFGLIGAGLGVYFGANA